MPAHDDVGEFAALLRRLKERTDRSYGSLARRLNMNTSTLHRYCAGDAVPLDYAPVERFAALCEASPEERLELHRLWLLAVAARQRPRTAPVPETEPQEEPSPAPPPRPWYRRRRIAVTAAVAAAILATLGSLSALPSGRPPADESAQAPVPSPATTSPGPSHRPSTPADSHSSGTAATRSPTARGGASVSPSRGGTAPGPGRQGSTDVPLTWTADSQVWAYGCGHDYVIAKSPKQVPPPPAPQDAGTWAATQGAVHGRETNVRISVQGRSSTAVVLEALRVRVAGRADPAPGTAYAMDEGCGGEISPRYFAVDLDVDRPIARSVAGADGEHTIPAVRMPYRVSAEDPEVLLVTARTEACDCRWYLELDWSSQGRTGTVRIDDHGRPFRTSGIEGLPRYAYDTSARQWRPHS